MIYLLGNPTRDTISLNHRSAQVYGGTVWYAALFLLGLGRSVSVIGNGNTEIKRHFERHGADVRNFSIGGPVAVFENSYTVDIRRQRAWPGRSIHLNDLPPEAFDSEAILAGPVLQEIGPAILSVPRTGCLMLDGQGFIRYPEPETVQIRPVAANGKKTGSFMTPPDIA